MECFRVSRNQIFSLPPTMAGADIRTIFVSLNLVNTLRCKEKIFSICNDVKEISDEEISNEVNSNEEN